MRMIALVLEVRHVLYGFLKTYGYRNDAISKNISTWTITEDDDA